MKYSVEFNSDKLVETLEVDGHAAKKTWIRAETGSIGLCCYDNDFDEQLVGVLDDEQLDCIFDTFDNGTFVSDIDDFIVNAGVE